MKKMRQISIIFFVFALSMLFYSGALSAQNMTVEMTNVATGDRLPECEDFTVNVNVTIQSGSIKEVRLYRNNTYTALDRSEPYEITWKKPVQGYYGLYAIATDDQGNKVSSDTAYIRVGYVANGDLLLNGEFTCSIAPWSLNYYEGAVASWNLDETDSWLSGGTLLTIEVTNGGSQIYNVQLAQSFPIASGHTYIVSFAADALADKPIEVMFQENLSPWQVYWSQAVTVDRGDFYGPFEYECTVDDPTAVLRFNFGLNTTTIYLDAVQIIDPSVEFLAVENQVPAQTQIKDFSLSQNYPNPFNSSTLIQYALPQSARVTIEIFNIMGQKVHTVVNNIQAAGLYQTCWDGVDNQREKVTSGIYFYRMSAYSKNMNLFNETRKLILLE